MKKKMAGENLLLKKSPKGRTGKYLMELSAMTPEERKEIEESIRTHMIVRIVAAAIIWFVLLLVVVLGIARAYAVVLTSTPQ